MASCTYDNPATMCREYWTDGKMLWCYSMELTCVDWGYLPRLRPWREGQIIGDSDALLKPRKEETK